LFSKRIHDHAQYLVGVVLIADLNRGTLRQERRQLDIAKPQWRALGRQRSALPARAARLEQELGGALDRHGRSCATNVGLAQPDWNVF
jgi:hypothetical protein